jgi:MFS family permease
VTDKTIWSSSFRAATFAILMVVALSAFDGLAITAAFPSITRDLGSVSIAPWIFTGYLAASAVAVIVGGPVIDAVGVRRTFRLTSIWFFVASAACAVAPTMLVLIFARIAQGAAGGILTAVSLAAIGLTYPDRLHARAFAAMSVVWGVMGFGGPAIGAIFLELGGWRSIFAIQLPLTAAAMVAGWNTLPSTRDKPTAIDYDRRGIVLITIVVVASIVAIDQIGSQWAVTVAGLALTGACAMAYVRHARRYAGAVLSLDHLTRLPMRWIHLVVMFVMAAGLASNNYLPLYMQIVRDKSTGFAAFSVLFVTIGWTAAANVASRLVDRIPEPSVIAAGAFANAPTLAVGAWMIAIDAPIAAIFGLFFVLGATIGTVSTPSLTMLQSISEDDELGRVNSAHQFLRSFAITLGVGLGSAVLFTVVGRQLGDVEIIRDALEGDDVTSTDEAIAAVKDGFVWVMVMSALVGTGAIAAAQALRRATRQRSSINH